MISRSLPLDDFLWALDHSIRKYRIRETRPEDRPQVRDPSLFITIVPLNGAAHVVMRPQCGLFPNPPEDSDHYASVRLNTISMAGAARAGVPRPEPDAVRLGHDFGSWCAELFRGEKLAQRIHCTSRAAAWTEVLRQEAAGLRRLPNAASCASNGRAG